MATLFVGRSTAQIFAVLLGMTAASTPGNLALAAQARLVHCGAETCLHLSGHRANAAVMVRIAGHDLAVEGGRSWRAIVPLRTARDWRISADGTLPLTLSDASTGIETADPAAIPPGALGRRAELANLDVRAD